MTSDLIDRLRLVRSPGIGPITFRQLIARFGYAAASRRRGSAGCSPARGHRSAAHVIEAVRPFEGRVEWAPVPFEGKPHEKPELDESAAREVEQLLGPSPVPVDEIIRLSGIPSGAVQMALLELDLAGRLDRHAGGKVSLRVA